MKRLLVGLLAAASLVLAAAPVAEAANTATFTVKPSHVAFGRVTGYPQSMDLTLTNKTTSPFITVSYSFYTSVGAIFTNASGGTSGTVLVSNTSPATLTVNFGQQGGLTAMKYSGTLTLSTSSPQQYSKTLSLSATLLG